MHPIKIEITLPSNINLLPLIGDIAELFIERINSNVENLEELAFRMNLAITEASANAIKHGNKNNENLPVKIVIEVLDNDLQIEIIDSGGGFEINNTNDFDNVPIDKDNGRGLLIINNLVDSVEYKIEDGEYKFIMKKKITD